MLSENSLIFYGKNRQKVNILIFILFAVILIIQLNHLESFEINNLIILPFCLGLILTPINWLLEYYKWLKLLKFLKLPNDRAKISFASGMVTDFLIPGIPTNFVGRINYFESSRRIALTAWIQLKNSIQFLITVLFGVISMFVLNNGNKILVISLTLLVILISILFLLPRFQKFLSEKISSYRIEVLSQSEIRAFIFNIMTISLLRMIVYTTQFYCFLVAFNINPEFNLLFWIWLSYLAVTISPSLIFGKLAVRESVSAAIFQIGFFPILPVIAASFCIWLFNGLIPTLFAWSFLVSSKSSDK